VLLPPHLAARRLLGSAAPERKAGSTSDSVLGPTPLPGPVTPRDRAVAEVLRSVADLLET
jgi:hypothetical protein